MPRRAPLAVDLNVTPLIDVLLVLLVIFMAALPLTQKGVDAELPPEARRTPPPGPSHIMVECDADRRIAVNREPVSIERLETRLRDIYEQRNDKRCSSPVPRHCRTGSSSRSSTLRRVPA